MKLRNPMKNKWGQWKDDATLAEKCFWSFIFVAVGMTIGNLIFDFFIQETIGISSSFGSAISKPRKQVIPIFKV